MARGSRKDRERQEDLWVSYADMAVGPAHPFYVREKGVRKVLCREAGASWVDAGIYFRSLMIGYGRIT